MALAAGALVGASTGIVGLVDPAWMQRVDNPFYDVAMQAVAEESSASDRIVLVHIDDPSLDWVEREYSMSWPWPRELYATLVAALRGWGARVVAIDVILDAAHDVYGWDDLEVFAEAMDELGGVVLGASLAAGTPAPPPETNYGAELERFEDRSEALRAASALMSLDRPAYLLSEGDATVLWTGGFERPEEVAYSLGGLRGMMMRVAPSLELSAEEFLDAGWARDRVTEYFAPRVGLVPEDAELLSLEDLFVRRFSLGTVEKEGPPRNPILPAALFLSSASQVGVVDQYFDPDGVMRQMRPVFRYDGAVMPSFPLAVLIAAAEEGGPPVGYDDGRVLIGDTTVPLDSQGRVGIWFHGKDPYLGVSAQEILRSYFLQQEGEDPSIDPSIFEDRIVIVSPTAVALMDRRPSPMSSSHIGSDINAAIIDGMLTHRWVRRVPPIVSALLAVLAAFGSALLAAMAGKSNIGERFGRIGGVVQVLFRAGIAVGSVALCFGPLALISLLLFRELSVWTGFGVWTGLALPLVSSVGGVVLYFTLLANAEGQNRRSMHDALGVYTSQKFANLVAEGGIDALAPARDDISVYFSDIQGFTSFSEQMEPEILADLLNVYLTEMTQVILDHDGLVDKYIGDAIMAFWGWRDTQLDHALRSVRCAIAMCNRLEALRPQLQQRFGVEIIARAGINSGVAVVGNMGSRQKKNVTLMGDVVNLAARLEGANKTYGTELMIGEATHERLHGEIECRELDLLRVKGKLRPVRVFEPMCLKGELPEGAEEWLGPYRKGIELYRDRQFVSAKAAFEAVLEIKPEDGPSAMYARRCGSFFGHPPPEDWDGVFVMTSK